MEIKKIFAECEALQKSHSPFTVLAPIEQETKDGPLKGYYISIKDCICTKGIETTSSSKILQGYIPLYDATVVQKLKHLGATIIGKTISDEFGFGSFCTHIGKQYTIPKHPLDDKRVTGGSSGGAALLTKKATFKHVAIAESTGGSIECPSSFCGVIGFVPTYGRISRYGVISYTASLDKVGLMAKEVKDIALVYDCIKGKDPLDGTSFTIEEEPKIKIQTIGIIKDHIEKADPLIQKAIYTLLEKLKSQYIIKEISLPFTSQYGLATYYCIATAEASTHLAYYTGLRYGMQHKMQGKHFKDYFKEMRTAYFHDETKRRAMIGTFVRMSGFRDQFYIKAAKVRQKIIDEYKEAFKTCDVLLSPTMPCFAPLKDDIEKLTPLETYHMDILTVGPSLSGIPHASFPLSTPLPSGIMVCTDYYKDDQTLHFLKILEDLQ